MSGVDERRYDIGVAVRRIVAILAAASAMAGCADHACTTLGWDEGLSVVLTPDPLPPGAYAFEVSAEGATAAVDVTVTASGSTCDGGSCRREADVGDRDTLRLDFRGDRLVVSYVEAGGGPEEAVVVVRRDGVEVAREVFAPDYREEEINGPGCGVATTAEVDLSVE